MFLSRNMQLHTLGKDPEGLILRPYAPYAPGSRTQTALCKFKQVDQMVMRVLRCERGDGAQHDLAVLVVGYMRKKDPNSNILVDDELRVNPTTLSTGNMTCTDMRRKWLAQAMIKPNFVPAKYALVAYHGIGVTGVPDHPRIVKLME
jgi:hypothetical protein